MPWLVYLASVVLLTLILTVVYALLTALLFGLHENYRRYWQRAELQWTGPDSRALKQRPLPMRIIFVLALASALAVVHLLLADLF